MLVSVKARSIGMVMRNAHNAWPRGMSICIGTLLTILRLRMHMYQKLFLRLRPALSSSGAITSLTFSCHSCCRSPLSSPPSRRSSTLRHVNTPRKLTRMAIHFVFGSANNLYKWRREWTTCKTVNGFVNTSTNDRVTPIKVPKCGGLRLVN